MNRDQRIARVLRDFYVAPVSLSSLQPVLDLAVELNPDLRPAAALSPWAPLSPSDPSAAAPKVAPAACSHLGATEAV
jgi:hypothetical protein